MKIALVDVDGHNFPNLALMKLSAWHKAKGDCVEWYQPLFSRPDKVYASKVFTFTPDYTYFPADIPVEKGGTGYRDYTKVLPPEIDATAPDYSIYPETDYAIGFLSRGCIRRCHWCVVPKKEGAIKQYSDIEMVAQGRKKVVLMDNNFLANDTDFVREQLEKSVKMKLLIDFNQGLDARLVNDQNAQWLAKCHWLTANGNNGYIRFACDTAGMIPHVKRAISMLRKAGYCGQYFIYFLAQEVDESIERIRQVLEIDHKINPFVMPFRNLDGDGKIVDDRLKELARWCNMASIRKSCDFADYKIRRKKLPPMYDECVPLDLRNATRAPDKKDSVNRQGVGVGEDGAPMNTVTVASVPGVGWQATVRRLLPVEAERLMGFPDNWTRIRWKGKTEEDCPDSPRYKACGNSMCVNVMRWIGMRIEIAERKMK